MELNSSSGFFVSNKELKETKFKINASAKAFKILSDGLYTNKIKAIIRELSCNAYDAHISAKTTDKKFEIYLPTAMSPEFSIRDFGTGLSKEDIENIYTTYFESTKTSSNELVGCLGLGSKTPFCYTDSFIVNSYFNGKVYSYNAYLDEEELPNVALISEKNTTEPNGLEVKFAVKERDHGLFAANACEVFYWFKEVPKINNISSAHWLNYYSDSDGAIIGKNWRAQKTLNGNRVGASVHVLMGNISYPVNLTDIDPGIKSILCSAELNLVLELQIGDVEIAASREALSLNKASRLKLKTIIEDAEKNFLSVAEADIMGKPSWLESCIAFSSLRDAFNGSYSSQEKFDKHFSKLEKDGNKIGVHIPLPGPSKGFYIPSWGGNIRTTTEYQVHVGSLKKYLFVDDVPADWSESKLRTFLRNYNAEKDKEVTMLLLIDSSKFSDPIKTWKTKYQIPKENYFLHGALPVIKATKVASGYSGRVGKKADDCYIVYDAMVDKFNRGYSVAFDIIDHYKKGKFDEDTTTPIFYIELNPKHRLQRPNLTGFENFDTLKYKVNALKDFAKFNDNIIGLTHRQVEGVSENKNIINIVDYFEQKMKETAQKEEFKTLFVLGELFDKIPKRSSVTDETLKKYRPKLNEILWDFPNDLKIKFDKAISENPKMQFNRKTLYGFLSEEEKNNIQALINEEYEKYRETRQKIEETIPNIASFFFKDLWSLEEKKIAAMSQLRGLLESECAKEEEKEVVETTKEI